MAVERLANASLPWELENEPLANDPKAFWELTIENVSNQFDLVIEKLANATSNRFDRIEERLDELASHLVRIHDQLHDLCKGRLSAPESKN